MTETLVRIEALTPDIEQSLLGVSDPLSQMDSITDDIESGVVQLYRTENGSLLAICKDGTDLLCVAYVGMDAHTVTEILIEVARQSKLTAVRFHTARKGLAKLLQDFKPELIQQVYRIPV